jgi:hypothetical protein
LTLAFAGGTAACGKVCYRTADQCCADSSASRVGDYFNNGCFAKPYCKLQYNNGVQTVSIVGELTVQHGRCIAAGEDRVVAVARAVLQVPLMRSDLMWYRCLSTPVQARCVRAHPCARNGASPFLFSS